MRLFISYAHVDWQFVENLARRLSRYHDVWYDDRLHAGVDWWETIQERLRWCDCFLYVLSPESLASEYCQEEYRIARELGRPVLPLRLQGNIELPPELARVQYADFATRMFEDALADLIGDLGVMERRLESASPPRSGGGQVAPAAAGRPDAETLLQRAVEARRKEDYEAAVRLLSTLTRTAPDFLPEQVSALIADSQQRLEALARRKEYRRLYRQIHLLALDGMMLEEARRLWEELRSRYPDIDEDPEGLGEKLSRAEGRPAPGAAAQKPAHILKGHSLWVRSVAWSPEGRYLASGAGDESVVIWDGKSWKRLRRLKGRGGEVRGVSWSPDGRYLASGAENGTATLWDTANWKPVRRLEPVGHTGSLAWSPDGRHLASGSQGDRVTIWDVERGNPVRELQGHASLVEAVAWSPDGQYLASGAGNFVLLWDTTTWETARRLKHAHGVRRVAWSPDGRRLASRTSDGLVLWGTERGEQMWAQQAPTDSAERTLTWSPEGRYLASEVQGKTVAIWDVALQEVIRRLEHASHVYSVAWSPDGKYLASGLIEGPVVVWDMSDLL